MSDSTIRRNQTQVARQTPVNLPKVKTEAKQVPEADLAPRSNAQRSEVNTTPEARELLEKPFDKEKIKNGIPAAPGDESGLASGTQSTNGPDLPENRTREDQARNVAALLTIRKDDNGDNVISREESLEGAPNREAQARQFESQDTDDNGELDRDEVLAFARERANDDVGFVPEASQGGSTGIVNARQILARVKESEEVALANERKQIDGELDQRSR